MRFMLRSYLRTRIKKIEHFARFYLVKSEDVKSATLMTESEKAYAKRFVEMTSEHFNASILDEIPEQLRSLDMQTEEINMVTEPNAESHVFIRVKEDIGDFVVDPINEPEEAIKLNQEEGVFLVRYAPVRQFAESHKIELV